MLAQKGAASGVAALDALGNVLRAGAVLTGPDNFALSLIRSSSLFSKDMTIGG
jgi:hypothetical protein